MIDHVRRFSMRPSRVEVQRAKDESIMVSKDVRSRRRVMRAVGSPVAGGGVLLAADFAGFARWFGNAFGEDLRAGLSEEEEARVRETAWKSFHGGVEEGNVWRKVLGELNARHRKAGEMMQQRAWSSPKRSFGSVSRLQGW